MHIDDATAFIIDYIQSPRSADGYPSYGYEVYLPNVIAAHLTEVEPSTTHHFQLRNSPRARELSPAFYEAAWDLCRRGVLRPGVKMASGGTRRREHVRRYSGEALPQRRGGLRPPFRGSWWRR
jgi:hypothetical protein